jgi:long-chain acyl-CoA synthetase
MTETVQSAIAAQLDALQIPSHIDADTYPSIVALFEEAFATYQNEAACSSVGHTLTYADLDRLSAQFAGWLQHGAAAWWWSIPIRSTPSGSWSISSMTPTSK